MGKLTAKNPTKMEKLISIRLGVCVNEQKNTQKKEKINVSIDAIYLLINR